MIPRRATAAVGVLGLLAHAIVSGALPGASSPAHAEPTHKRAAPFSISTEATPGPDAVAIRVQVEPLVPLLTLRVTVHGLDAAGHTLEERSALDVEAPTGVAEATAVIPRSPTLARVLVKVDATLPGGGEAADVKQAWSMLEAPRGVLLRGRDGRQVLELPGARPEGAGAAGKGGGPPVTGTQR